MRHRSVLAPAVKYSLLGWFYCCQDAAMFVCVCTCSRAWSESPHLSDKPKHSEKEFAALDRVESKKDIQDSSNKNWFPVHVSFLQNNMNSVATTAVEAEWRKSKNPVTRTQNNMQRKLQACPSLLQRSLFQTPLSICCQKKDASCCKLTSFTAQFDYW